MHVLRDADDADDGEEVYPDAVWSTQIAQALRGLIHHANLARNQGRPTINDAVKTQPITRFRHGVPVGLSHTASDGTRPRERKARLLLEVLRDREADVSASPTTSTCRPTSNQADRDLRPSKVQQKISGRLTSEQRTQDRYKIRGYLSTAARHRRNMMTVLAGTPWMPPLPVPA